jgi:beta-mannosidase
MEVFNLDGKWVLTEKGSSKLGEIQASVPGCVHGDLLAAGKIEDPFYRDNELKVAWISQADWIYRREFTLSDDLLKRDRVLLHCDGLDTLGVIKINGTLVGQTDNMFRTWEFDIKKFLHAGVNSIEIEFASAEKYAVKRQAEHPIPDWFGIWQMGISGRAWIRKEQCNFGWDWSLSITTAGIWRSISIVAFDTARLSDVLIRQDHSRAPQKVVLNIETSVETTKANAKLSGIVRIKHQGSQVAQAQLKNHGEKFTAQIELENPKLWWPNGMGAQPLYSVEVELLDEQGKTLDKSTKRIGLRTIELVRENDQWGQSFYFKANGVPFFVKGSNWIPADAILSRMTRERYFNWIADAAAVHINMLRAWGGGIYEDDAFYDACDEMGVCIWQDFAFGCSTYPTFDDDFMKTCKAEFEDNIRRMRNHPCIALWVGNNELEQGLVADTWTKTAMSWADYDKLYNDLLPSVMKRLNPDAIYWPGSPHNPINRKDFNCPTAGDAHLWQVWHGRQPFEWYQTCEHRFNSEFGFQSMPEPRTIESFTLPKDRNLTSWVMERHQRSPIGNSAIMQSMMDWFLIPTTFDNTAWVSQILHGVAMKFGVEHWRRSMPRGMGTMYWQFNDCWPGMSWASVDYFGRWKATHYMAKKFYSTILISGLPDATKKTAEIHVTSDLQVPCEGTISWTLTDLDGKTITSGELTKTFAANTNTPITTLNLEKELRQYDPREVMLWLKLTVAGKEVSENLLLFVRPKHMELRNPNIRMTLSTTDNRNFTASLEAEKPALWAWISKRGTDAKFSDNFFAIRPGEKKTVNIKTSELMDVHTLAEELSVQSLFDTYTTTI